ncbi:Uncharacterized protein Rs2_38401 [Raphanus sativus]|nr:Uncharacterized protein Rs2_38401 [Raphanus sativus]
MVSSQIISLMYSPIVFPWEAWNMKELAVSNFIILIIDKQVDLQCLKDVLWFLWRRCVLKGVATFLIYLKKKTVKAMIMSGGPKHFKLTVRRGFCESPLDAPRTFWEISLQSSSLLIELGVELRISKKRNPGSTNPTTLKVGCFEGEGEHEPNVLHISRILGFTTGLSTYSESDEE